MYIAWRRSLNQFSSLNLNTLGLRIIVGWVERSETQQSTENVGFRPSTQPTQVKVFDFNPSVLV